MQNYETRYKENEKSPINQTTYGTFRLFCTIAAKFNPILFHLYAVVLWGETYVLFEETDEVGRVGEAYGASYLLHGVARGEEQLLGMLNFFADDVLQRRNAKGRAKETVEVRLGYAPNVGELVGGDFVGNVLLHKSGDSHDAFICNLQLGLRVLHKIGEDDPHQALKLEVFVRFEIGVRLSILLVGLVGVEGGGVFVRQREIGIELTEVAEKEVGGFVGFRFYGKLAFVENVGLFTKSFEEKKIVEAYARITVVGMRHEGRNKVHVAGPTGVVGSWEMECCYAFDNVDDAHEWRAVVGIAPMMSGAGKTNVEHHEISCRYVVVGAAGH